MSKRFQLVGSLLRPEYLLKYKAEIEKREDITYPFYNDFPGYREAEEKAAKDVIQEQIHHQIDIVSDGEFSKSLWHLDFAWGLAGIERFINDHGYFFRDIDGEGSYETRKDIGLRIVGTLSGKNHHFIDVYTRILQEAKGQETKLCIPSPSHIYGELSWSDNIRPDGVYTNLDELKAGLAKAYKEFLDEYAAVGGTIIQFDDCLWTLFADDNPTSPFSGERVNSEQVKKLAEDFVTLNNEVIAHGHALGLKVWTHNCRGNYSSRNAGGGSYQRIANIFLKNMNYDRFFLEWDDDRAGSIDALEVFKDKDTEVVLGLLSSKTRTLDDENRVTEILDKAAKILPKERLYLSHQCGFASCDCGNELTQDEQWKKIDQGQRLAKEYWGQ